MISRKAWLGVVVVLGIIPALVLCVGYRFVPVFQDLSDPLGRPSNLSLGLVNSAQQFDIITGELVPKHKELSGSIQTLHPVARDLAKLTGEAGKLSDLAITLNTSTAGIARIAGGLPEKIDLLTGRATVASPVVSDLTGSIGGVTTELRSVSEELGTIQTSLSALGPKARGIAATLAHVEEEAAHVREFGPLLALLGPAVNGPKAPAPAGPPKP